MKFLSEPSFVQRKPRLMNMYSSLMSDMNIDYGSTEIGIENIRNLSRSILNFSEEISKMAKQVTKENEEEKKWLTEMIIEFSSNLKLWMNRHIDELAITENLMQEESLWESPALVLARKRLELLIDNLKSTKVLL